MKRRTLYQARDLQLTKYRNEMCVLKLLINFLVKWKHGI